MKILPITATRSVKIKDLNAEYKAHPAIKSHKGDEYPFGLSDDATAEFAEHLAEAISVEGGNEEIPAEVLDFLKKSKGAAKAFDFYARQKKTDVQNEQMTLVLNKVLDPSKNKRSGGAIKVAL